MNELKFGMCLVMGLLAGCASERIVLLPSTDGAASAVVVRDAAGEQRLDKPYAALKRQGDVNRPYQASAEEVEERFGAALAAQPARSANYVLYFVAGGNELTAESQALVPAILKEISGRAASEVMVVGHTDRVGKLEGNDQLSQKRAERVRDLLVEAGVPPGKLEAVGRGERDPLVPTDDEVDEPKNRRVEINVR